MPITVPIITRHSSDQWRTISQKNSLIFNKLTVYDQFPVFEISNQLVQRNEPALYISAGIHGDKVAHAGDYWIGRAESRYSN